MVVMMVMMVVVVVVTVVVTRVWVWEVRGHDWNTAREESVAEAERSCGWGLEVGFSISTRDTFISQGGVAGTATWRVQRTEAHSLPV